MNWNTPSYLKILGEVKHPGKYTIELGKTRISDIIERAGGFTDNAYKSASILIRQKELDREDLELKRLEKEGFKIITKEPKKGADNKLIAFLHPKSTNGVLIELCQEIEE